MVVAAKVRLSYEICKKCLHFFENQGLTGDSPVSKNQWEHRDGYSLMTPDLLANKNQRAQICARYLLVQR